jgi:hypothetical protein
MAALLRPPTAGYGTARTFPDVRFYAAIGGLSRHGGSCGWRPPKKFSSAPPKGKPRRAMPAPVMAGFPALGSGLEVSDLKT